MKISNNLDIKLHILAEDQIKKREIQQKINSEINKGV
jgi:hypothetical protein